jgi:hypothetical protein
LGLFSGVLRAVGGRHDPALLASELPRALFPDPVQPGAPAQALGASAFGATDLLLVHQPASEALFAVAFGRRRLRRSLRRGALFLAQPHSEIGDLLRAAVRRSREQSPNREHASEAAGGGRQRRALGAHVNNPVKHDFLLGLGRERVNDERGRHLLSPLDPSPKALASLGFALFSAETWFVRKPRSEKPPSRMGFWATSISKLK